MRISDWSSDVCSSDLAGVGIEVHEPSLVRMKERSERARFQLTPNNLRQVRVPVGASPFLNPAGTAPGFELSVGGATLFVMPGELGRAPCRERVCPYV